jgi:hypothetical protein
MTSDCLPHQLVLQMDPTELEMHLRALAPVGGSSAASSATAAAAAAAASTSAAAAATHTTAHTAAHTAAHTSAQLGAHPARDRDHEHEHHYLEMVDRLDTSLNLDDDQLGAELGAGDADGGALDRSRSHNQVRAPSDCL